MTKPLKQRIVLKLHRLMVRLGLIKGNKWERQRRKYGER